MERAFRLFDFTVYNQKGSSSGDTSSSEDESTTFKKEDKTKFQIQMFGINEHGETCSILVEDFKPFFYVKVDDFWNIQIKTQFLEEIKKKIGKYYENCITECKLIKRKKLYGFDGNREHKFIVFQFENMQAFNKAKNIWYDSSRKLLPNGYFYRNSRTYLYEANIPPLLRFFHIKDISPSGWIALPNKKTTEYKNDRKTTCTFEFSISYKDIIPLNNKETRVPYKICSFDIEASSSHGDFPVPIKSYKKLATNIVEYFESLNGEITSEQCKSLLRKCILSAHGFTESMVEIDLVYPKKPIKTMEICESLIDKWLKTNIRTLDKSSTMNEVTIETMFEKMHQNQNQDEEDGNGFSTFQSKYTPSSKKDSIVDLMCDRKFERNAKILEVNVSLNSVFPKLEGDKITFIGSTFVKYGEPEPYYNHCAVLNTCDQLEGDNSKIDSYSTEKEVLLAWTQLIQKENPDIIIGYNIFGFDYEFMFHRAEENGCLESFLNLSKNRGEICASKDYDTGKYKMEESTLQIASGQHDLKYIKMNGRVQIDMYNFFRREENLTSYKLDYVAGYFIGDYVKKLDATTNTTIYTGNLTGLLPGSYIHFEEIGHSVDYYKDGEKFKVVSVNKTEGHFEVVGKVSPDMTKKVRWCLAKDDVTPKDIFRMANGDSQDRAVVAKYCIQDCNLVHYLMRKVDVFTGFIEMAKICSVPINFLIMRGQGIKLTSYVAKKCREKNTLMPVIEKLDSDDGYEGAIVLDPKCDLYLDNPVACVDYASLYPSSMMSENLSHDSKVWTKEYDLDGVLVAETGEKNTETCEFIYDNLPDYEYVNITYDTFKYIRKSPTSSAEKVKSGYKICRFAQFPNGTRAIMPSILEELLTARKTTRKLIPLESDEFMKNVLDKRQLGYKVTANSLYGQCGARTSTFYEKDIAASTTATGRLLLTYAKKVIEECYGDSMCQTANYGPVLTKAEYIYGDTDSVFFTFNLQELDGTPIRGKKALDITIELAQEAGHLASKFLKGPHDLEYEKTFMPFCLLSKKRYVGMLYEHDPNKGKRKEMGIVLKRRDNAPIVKEIYGGIIDILMKEQDIGKATDFLKACLKNIVEEKYAMDKLIITKSLRSGYKNPQQIAHKVLADRITSRDPGNKPSSGDRIPFVYVHHPNKKALQGEKIETPIFIKENNLKIDYSFYITNQIMKPVQQVFALVLEKIWTMQNKKSKIAKFKKEIEHLRETTENDEKFQDKLDKLRNKEVKTLLFDEFLRETNNQKESNQAVTKFFGKR